MSSAAAFEDARGLAVKLERGERSRGSDVAEARRVVARRVGVGPGTFENLVRGRVKRVDAWLRDRLRAVVIRELEAEIARLSHELELVRQSGSRPDSLVVSEIEAHLSKAKALLNEGAS